MTQFSPSLDYNYCTISEVHYMKAGENIEFVVAQQTGDSLNVKLNLIIESSY